MNVASAVVSASLDNPIFETNHLTRLHPRLLDKKFSRRVRILPVAETTWVAMLESCVIGGGVSASAFDVFYRENYALILRFAERRIDRETAAEVTSEAFMIAWKSFDPQSPPALPWLYQTARNLIGNAYRKRGREMSLLERLRGEAATGSKRTPSDMDLAGVMGRLQSKAREALELTYWEGLSAAEVAVVVGCSEQAAWKRIGRAKTALRELLVEVGEEEQADVR